MTESTASNSHDASRALSPLSFTTTTEDWDRSLSDISPPSPIESKPGEENGLPAKRSLSDLVRLYAQTTGVALTEEEERRVREELGNWVNSDLSPYEALNAVVNSDKDKAAASADGTSS